MLCLWIGLSNLTGFHLCSTQNFRLHFLLESYWIYVFLRSLQLRCRHTVQTGLHSTTDVIQPGIVAIKAIVVSSLWALRALILSIAIRSVVTDGHVSLREGYYVYYEFSSLFVVKLWHSYYRFLVFPFEFREIFLLSQLFIFAFTRLKILSIVHVLGCPCSICPNFVGILSICLRPFLWKMSRSSRRSLLSCRDSSPYINLALMTLL